MQKFFKTLRTQLIIWLTIPLIVLWSISTVIDFDIAKRFVNLAYDRALLETALDIGRQIKTVNNRIYIDLPDVAVQMLQTRESGRIAYLVTGPNGEFITGEPDLPLPSEDSADRVRYYDDEFRGRQMRVVALRVPVDPGSGRGAVQIHVAERVTVRRDFAGQIILRMALPQALLIIAAALAVWYGIARGLAPLANLRREIEQRSHRDLSALPEEESPQEVQPLIRAMNDLLQRLSAAIAAQQRFIADAAHQLRTPIAGLKTQTELALRQSQGGGVDETLRQLRVATEQTTRLINQLLSLARAEPGAQHSFAMEPLDLDKLVREAAIDWVPRALERKIDLGYDQSDSPVRILGNAFLLREMLNNLLDNAIRYTQPEGQVTVCVTAQAARVVLSVEDNGPGIPASERARVFERFYRVLGSGVEGCGLGLAIVREIAQSHGADVKLRAGANGAGTVVSVVFPAAENLRAA
ncbi:MAG: sensor histidine kinase N-terminal domain-containing protein [Betaproteobacteria bacterium]|nr:sensor histidine kinase N-terminal domain-containing protein [Betaproteobacteria bacterium]